MKIALIGDVMLGRLVNEVLKKKEPAYPWGNTLALLRSLDLRICNLECVLSDVGNPWSATPKVFHFRSDEKNIETLKEACIDMVSLANNHVLDYEEEALLRMLDLLNAQNISYAGAGRNGVAASQAAIFERREEKIGLIAFTDNEPAWEAKEKKPGIFYVPIRARDKRAKQLFTAVRNLRQKVDFVIVSAHWGPNWGYEPPKEHRAFAHALIEAGADLIFGHSGHVFRGIEVYKECPILYSAGDFVDDYAVDEVEKNDEAFLFVLEKTEEQGVQLFLYPTYIDKFQAHLATHGRKEAILSKMKNLCEDLGTCMVSLPDYALIEIRKPQ